MARYRGPRVKCLRALGVDLPGLTRKSQERRPHPPGEHGQTARRKESEYGIRLKEKQKLALHYGLCEGQMRRYVRDARRSKMAMGDKLIELLERRLDNVVFRAGFAPTMPAARQLVTHGHFLVDGKKVHTPSYRTKVGMVVEPKTKSRDLAALTECFEPSWGLRPNWLEIDQEGKKATLRDNPTVSTVPFTFEPQLVVEFYSRVS
jgi:small subunit ribosomal protein S4